MCFAMLLFGLSTKTSRPILRERRLSVMQRLDRISFIKSCTGWMTGLRLVTSYNVWMSNPFRPEHRVRKQADFDRVYAERLFAADGVLIVNAAENGLPHSRLGLSIGKIVGKAVVRNRWKRLIREAFRLSCSDLPTGFDFVVRPQKAAVAEFEPIRKSLVALTTRIAKRIAKSTANSNSREQTCSRNAGE